MVTCASPPGDGFPFTPGFDLAGRVLACGPSVTGFRPGDRVMALLGHRGGGLAEQVLLRQSPAARVPTSLASVQAAAHRWRA